jgi:SAM-dependent methyltransferase
MSNDREKGLKRLNNLTLKYTNPGYLHYSSLFKNLHFSIQKYARGKLLDIGCGNKPYSEWIDKVCAVYIGVDIIQSSENKVDVICDATQITLLDSTFDTVFSSQAVEHIAEHEKVFKEAFRLLRPGGHFIVSAPMYWPLHEEPYDFFRFTKHGFKFLMEKTGFETIEILSCGGKWSLMGQTVLITLPSVFTRVRAFRYLSNRLFSWLDTKYYNDINTMCYVVIGLKPVK